MPDKLTGVDLELVPELDLINELHRRYDCVVVGLVRDTKHSDLALETEAHLVWFRGGRIRCVGLLAQMTADLLRELPIRREKGPS